MGMIGNLVRVTTTELEKILKDSSVLESKVYDEDSDGTNVLDLDKSWEAIYYLLTGHPIAGIEDVKPPLSLVLLSGQFIDGEQDMGYGPAHYITADQVKQLNEELDKITSEELRNRYNGKQMDEAGVYPEVWSEDESMDYVMDYFEQLKEFYRIAESKHMAVISFVS